MWLHCSALGDKLSALVRQKASGYKSADGRIGYRSLEQSETKMETQGMLVLCGFLTIIVPPGFAEVRDVSGRGPF